jgi:hypothetical protein
MNHSQRQSALNSLMEVWKELLEGSEEGYPWALGFVTSGGRIITAAHCLRPTWNTPEPPLDSGAGTLVRTLGSEDVGTWANLVTYELCSDLAVLVPTAAAEMADGHPARIRLGVPRDADQVQVELYVVVSRDPRRVAWVNGVARRPTSESAAAWRTELSEAALDGSSGTPVFDEGGLVMGILTQAVGTQGNFVLLAAALPAWIASSESEATRMSRSEAGDKGPDRPTARP